jgi:hypothetical protein
MHPHLKAFLVHNPWWGFGGFVLGVLGILLAIYFYAAGKEAVDIRYYVNPVRAVIAKAGVDSALSVLYNNQPVSDDVTSVSIAIWNAGKKPVNASDVLAPLQFVVAPEHGILDAKLVTATRDVVGLQIDKTALTTGVVPMKFRILEHNDGGIVQLLYRGDSNVKILMHGAVIGQRSIKAVVYPGTLQTQADQVRSKRQDLLAVLSTAVVATMIMVVATITTKKVPRLIVIGTLLLLGLTVYLWYHNVNPAPPFDFG